MIKVSVTTETNEQVFAAISSPAPDIVYLDGGFSNPADWQTMCMRAHESGKRCGLRLPSIWRTEAERFFAAHAKALFDAGFDALLIGSIENLGFLKRHGVTLPLVFDSSVYDYNGFAERMIDQFLQQADLSHSFPENMPDQNARPPRIQTLPQELSQRELSRLSEELYARGTEAELIVYSRTRMMTTAQCVRRTTLCCDKHPVTMELVDRTGAHLPVKNCCRFCENRIYNAVPTFLIDQKQALTTVRHSYERCDFTTESAEAVKHILRCYEMPDQAVLPREFTRGAWKRGIA